MIKYKVVIYDQVNYIDTISKEIICKSKNEALKVFNETLCLDHKRITLEKETYRDNNNIANKVIVLSKG